MTREQFEKYSHLNTAACKAEQVLQKIKRYKESELSKGVAILLDSHSAPTSFEITDAALEREILLLLEDRYTALLNKWKKEMEEL